MSKLELPLAKLDWFERNKYGRGLQDYHPEINGFDEDLEAVLAEINPKGQPKKSDLDGWDYVADYEFAKIMKETNDLNEVCRRLRMSQSAVKSHYNQIGKWFDGILDGSVNPAQITKNFDARIGYASLLRWLKFRDLRVVDFTAEMGYGKGYYHAWRENHASFRSIMETAEKLGVDPIDLGSKELFTEQKRYAVMRGDQEIVQGTVQELIDYYGWKNDKTLRTLLVNYKHGKTDKRYAKRIF